MAIVDGSIAAPKPYTDRALKSLSLFIGLPLAAGMAFADIPPCPPGTTIEGAGPPAGLERKCVGADGLAEGPWLTWYGSGQLMSERGMKRGREHGRQRSWWPNGRLMMEGTSYEGNRYQGFKYWSIDGAPAALDVDTQTITRPLDAPPAAAAPTDTGDKTR